MDFSKLGVKKEELPQELLDQLSKTKGVKYVIIDAFVELGGNATADELVIKCWQLTKEVHTRASVIQALHAFKKEGLTEKTATGWIYRG
jgi:ribosomal protein L7Ae-like RNA K-turn-binding protein